MRLQNKSPENKNRPRRNPEAVCEEKILSKFFLADPLPKVNMKSTISVNGELCLVPTMGTDNGENP
jgi:hypothetical protein